ncbi:RNA-guided endonuclease InsQ/TnpB family protein [Microseira sp. BLCC-F43]|jgi:putative transposase|uniref:RNA-guided endonuclease InsQ/TnpB family protein n=1 Tax=Microseira sp. BLCC-F43 TaxID=3153602 RepID=UPI0035B94669
MDWKKQLPIWKKQKETEWLKETYSQCLQQAVLNLSPAFVNFFQKRAGYPQFKSRHGKESLQYPANVKIVDGAVKFPFLGEIRANLHRQFDGQLKTVTIAKTKTDKYYASLLFEDDKPESVVSSLGKAIGIDLGLTHFCITSEASKYDNPRHFKKQERQLKRKQRKLYRKQKGSNSRNKARKLVAISHEKIANSRQDLLHKLSRKIVNENQAIVSENLNVKGIVRNHNQALAISDCGWSMFLNFIEYKAKRDGKTFLEIDRFFPSWKTCSVCLNIVDSLPQDIRSWECPHCHTRHDRDVNAAINKRDEGLRLLASGTGATADGGNVRPNRGRKSSVAVVPREVRRLHSALWRV